MSTSRQQGSWRSGTRQPGGQDVPIADDVRDEHATSAPREHPRDQNAGVPTEVREVRAADPELSPETNAALTEELRDVVGSGRVEVPVDHPHAAEGEFPDRQSAGVLSQHRFQILRATAIAFTFGAIVALATGKWWLILVAVGVHALGTLTVTTTILRMTTAVEHPSPEVAAAMAEEGVPNPDERFTTMVEEFSPESRRGFTETATPGFNDRTTESGDDTAASATQQSSSMTPTAEPSESGGTGGAPDLILNTTAGALLVLSFILPITSGGGWMWLLPAVMVPLLIGFVLLERVFATARGKGVAAERKSIITIVLCTLIAAAILAGVVALAFNKGSNHGSSTSNFHGAVPAHVQAG